MIGVLALQGDFAEHMAALKRLGVDAREVRTPGDLHDLSGLIIPGGESTTISKLLDRWGLREPIVRFALDGRALWGTCAGLILIAKRVTDGTVRSMGLLDIDVQRNAYGSQLDSFETDVAIPAFGASPMRTIFIRAPVITRVGPSVEVLASLPDGTPIAVRNGNILGSSFHPELTQDTRFTAILSP
jgi:5'-phosphate synthase pdxT subunit